MKFNYDEDTIEVFGKDTVNRIEELISNSENDRIQATPYLFNIQKQKKVHRLFFEKNYIGNKGDRILDFGPGSGVGIYMGRYYGYEAWGLDVDQVAIGFSLFDEIRDVLKVRDYIKLYNGNEKFPFPDNYFNSFYAKNSIHHIKTTNEVNKPKKQDIYTIRMKEINRIMKPGGILYISNRGAKIFKPYFLKNNTKKLRLFGMLAGEIHEFK